MLYHIFVVITRELLEEVHKPKEENILDVYKAYIPPNNKAAWKKS